MHITFSCGSNKLLVPTLRRGNAVRTLCVPQRSIFEECILYSQVVLMNYSFPRSGMVMQSERSAFLNVPYLKKHIPSFPRSGVGMQSERSAFLNVPYSLVPTLRRGNAVRTLCVPQHSIFEKCKLLSHVVLMNKPVSFYLITFFVNSL